MQLCLLDWEPRCPEEFTQDAPAWVNNRSSPGHWPHLATFLPIFMVLLVFSGTCLVFPYFVSRQNAQVLQTLSPPSLCYSFWSLHILCLSAMHLRSTLVIKWSDNTTVQNCITANECHLSLFSFAHFGQTVASERPVFPNPYGFLRSHCSSPAWNWNRNAHPRALYCLTFPSTCFAKLSPQSWLPLVVSCCSQWCCSHWGREASIRMLTNLTNIHASTDFWVILLLDSPLFHLLRLKLFSLSLFHFPQASAPRASFAIADYFI